MPWLPDCICILIEDVSASVSQGDTCWNLQVALLLTHEGFHAVGWCHTARDNPQKLLYPLESLGLLSKTQTPLFTLVGGCQMFQNCSEAHTYWWLSL